MLPGRSGSCWLFFQICFYMKPKRENDNPKLANQKNQNQKSNLTFHYLIAIYLGVFQFHNMLQSGTFVFQQYSKISKKVKFWMVGHTLFISIQWQKPTHFWIDNFFFIEIWAFPKALFFRALFVLWLCNNFEQSKFH